MLAPVDELLLRNKRFGEAGEKLTRKGFQSRGRLGAGATSEVHAAVSLFTGRAYAIATVPLGAGTQRRLEEQLRTLARCSHEHVLHLHAAWEEEGSALLVSELAETTLLERLRRQKGFSEAEAGAVAADLCKALVYLHGLCPPVYRRELRPQHALLVGGRWKLGGFGRPRAEEGAPEPLAGERADAWALGALLYELLHGRPPFPGRGQPGRLELDRQLSEEAAEALGRMLGPSAQLQCTAREALDLAFFRRQRGVPYALSASQRALALPEEEALLGELLGRCEQAEKRQAELLKELQASEASPAERARQAALEEQLAEARRQLAATEGHARELDAAIGQSGSGVLALQAELQRKHEHNQALCAFARELGETVAALAGRPAPPIDPFAVKAALGALLGELARGSAR